MSIKSTSYQFRNHYYHCGIQWSSEWNSACNDKCSLCCAEVEPYKSDDLLPTQKATKAQDPADIHLANDWKAVVRDDGSIYFTCGDPKGSYHMAFDINLDADLPANRQLAQRFCEAMNAFNSR